MKEVLLLNLVDSQIFFTCNTKLKYVQVKNRFKMLFNIFVLIKDWTEQKPAIGFLVSIVKRIDIEF